MMIALISNGDVAESKSFTLALHLNQLMLLISAPSFAILSMTQCVMDGIMLDNSFIGSYETKTGIIVHARPLQAEDAPYLVDLFENMGPESRYNRFMQAVDHVGIDRVWHEAEQVAHQTNDRSFGLVAFADLPQRHNTPIAAARYVSISSTQAELAVSVRDDMQHMGIGTWLMEHLMAIAVEHGIEQLVGTIQNGNTAMWALLKKIGCRLERQPEGSYSQVTIHLCESGSRINDWLDTAADFSPEPQIIW
jgi:RimJ/RimL family protein N-acetyltransferase